MYPPPFAAENKETVVMISVCLVLWMHRSLLLLCFLYCTSAQLEVALFVETSQPIVLYRQQKETNLLLF